MVRHRDRVAVPELLDTPSIGFEYRCVSRRCVRLHPLEKRRTNIEAHRRIEIVTMFDFTIGAENSRLRHRSVALRFDPLIPVVKRRSGRLGVYLSGPGIFARRLIEMAVHDNGSTHLLRHTLRESRMFGKIASRTSSSFASSLAFAKSPLLPSSPRMSRAQSEM